MRRSKKSRVNYLVIINVMIAFLASFTVLMIILSSCKSSALCIPEYSLMSSTGDIETSEASVSTMTDPYYNMSQPHTSASESTDAEITPEWKPDRKDVEAIAKTLWGECRGVKSTAQQAAVAWCILNRVDEGGYFGSSIIEVVSKPNQFAGYNPNYPVTADLAALAEDVLIRWHAEKEGAEDVGRTLPKGYCYFVGDGTYNYFTKEWKSKDYWDWSLPNPYES